MVHSYTFLDQLGSINHHIDVDVMDKYGNECFHTPVFYPDGFFFKLNFLETELEYYLFYSNMTRNDTASFTPVFIENVTNSSL